MAEETVTTNRPWWMTIVDLIYMKGLPIGLAAYLVYVLVADVKVGLADNHTALIKTSQENQQIIVINTDIREGQRRIEKILLAMCWNAALNSEARAACVP